jgi:hypothetical protein
VAELLAPAAVERRPLDADVADAAVVVVGGPDVHTADRLRSQRTTAVLTVHEGGVLLASAES